MRGGEASEIDPSSLSSYTVANQGEDGPLALDLPTHITFRRSCGIMFNKFDSDE